MKEKRMEIISLFGLTILPSAIATAVYFFIGLYWQKLPSLDLFFIVAVLLLFPFELWIMLSANKKECGKKGLQIIFSEQEPMEWWKTVLYGIALFGFAGLMSVTIGPLEEFIMKDLSNSLFSALPAYFDWTDMDFMKQYPKGILLLTCGLYLVLNVFVCPIIEEIYFRGYLTSRLKNWGLLAPILVSVAFSLYHWWLPFNNLFRISIFCVASVVAYKKKNIYITILFHCCCNLLSTIDFITMLLG